MAIVDGDVGGDVSPLSGQRGGVPLRTPGFGSSIAGNLPPILGEAGNVSVFAADPADVHMP